MLLKITAIIFLIDLFLLKEVSKALEISTLPSFACSSSSFVEQMLYAAVELFRAIIEP